MGPHMQRTVSVSSGSTTSEVTSEKDGVENNIHRSNVDQIISEHMFSVSNQQLASSMPGRKRRKFADTEITNFIDAELTLPPRKTFEHVTDKELRKKLKNRESAQAARDRKKIKMMQLENQVATLLERNRILELENRDLKARLFSQSKDNIGWQKPSIHQNHQGQFYHSHSHMHRQFSPRDHSAQLSGNTAKMSGYPAPNANGYNPNQRANVFSYYSSNHNDNLILNPRQKLSQSYRTSDDKITNRSVQYLVDEASTNNVKTDAESCTRFESTSLSGMNTPSPDSTDLNAEQWLMLSFKPELESQDIGFRNANQNRNNFQENQVQNFETPEIEWGNFQIENVSCMEKNKNEMSPDIIPVNSHIKMDQSFDQDVYYDSNAMDNGNISSPDGMYTFENNSTTISQNPSHNKLHNSTLQVS